MHAMKMVSALVMPCQSYIKPEATSSSRSGQESLTRYNAVFRTMQVLNIVYGGSAAKPSAFYPKGVNGNINGTA